MDQDTAKYIVNYFSSLLNEEERLAVRHIHSVIKLELDTKQINSSVMANTYKKMGWLSENENVLSLLKDGYDPFEITVAKRILDQHKAKVFLNYCPKCGKLARTPFAKQCRFCLHNWH